MQQNSELSASEVVILIASHEIHQNLMSEGHLLQFWPQTAPEFRNVLKVRKTNFSIKLHFCLLL